MKISARLMEVLQAIYWNVGSDLEQGVNFVWSDSIFSGTYSYIATGRAIKGDESRLRITPFLLNDLERNELITVRKVFSEIGGKMIEHQMIQLLPAGLQMVEQEEKQQLAPQPDARQARILLDTVMFKEMLQLYFTIQDHKDICLALGLDYESLVPVNTNKAESARLIVEHARMQARLMDLWRVAQSKNPGQDWLAILKG